METMDGEPAPRIGVVVLIVTLEALVSSITEVLLAAAGTDLVRLETFGIADV